MDHKPGVEMAQGSSGINIPSLSSGEFATVYNLLSLVIASMLFTSLFLLFSRNRVSPRYRNALVVSATVCGIAAYHYFRIFDNFKASYPPGTSVTAPHMLSNVVFNEAYRYVDWFLTVPLLLVETVAVMALPRAEARALLFKLVPSSALMIALGYPGEIASSKGTKGLFFALSTLVFIYIVYVLFVELGRSIGRQPESVRGTIKLLRTGLVITWCVYPVAFLFPLFGGSFFGGAGGFVLRQAGYSIADIVAKAVYGLVIFKVARDKSRAEDPAQYDEEYDAQPLSTSGSSRRAA
jgi:bacteriorhodopsin